MATTATTLAPALPIDYPTMARVECDAFWNEEFSRVAFGALRGSDEAISDRAESFAKAPKNPKERLKYVKAVRTSSGGEEEIVGFAQWNFVSGKGEEDVDRERGEDGNGQDKEEKSPWSPRANVKFCEEFFGWADETMMRSIEGDEYAKLSVLVVSPKCQRMGIGTKLLEEGLREVDDAGWQAVLGASPDGEGLYKKFGFQEFDFMERNLWEYEGGEGCGVARHVVMHRPAKKHS